MDQGKHTIAIDEIMNKSAVGQTVERHDAKESHVRIGKRRAYRCLMVGLSDPFRSSSVDHGYTLKMPLYRNSIRRLTNSPV